MKKLFVIAALLCSKNLMASEQICGVEVQSQNILQAEIGTPINYVRAMFEWDRAITKECRNETGVFIVGTFPNGEVRAVVF